MKRLIWLLLCTPVIAQQPGTYLIQHQTIAGGCLADLNNAKLLKQTGLCSLSFVAQGIKLPDLECHSSLSLGADTIIDCTYSPIKRLSRDFQTPVLKAGETLIPAELITLTDGCMQVNNSGNKDILGKCGFNVVLQNVLISGMSCTVKVGGGNTTMTCEYPKA